ncbi:hypothetical protein ACFYUL_23925 [Streptomyces sp. NPDC004311]|uniref:hypothetical protein n=1 Tax=Streptomyces sp. NPDC004311 TaxID=3364698 RepID=UPI00368C24AC
MTTVVSDDLVVTGAVSAGNILMGSVVMSPETNTPTSVDVLFNHPKPSLTGQVNPLPQALPNVMLTAISQEPWSKIRELGTRFSSTTGVTIYIYRTNDVDTVVNWLSWQEPNL